MIREWTATAGRGGWQILRRSMRSDAGVSMIEMVVVLAILGAATAVVMPRLERRDPTLALRTAAHEVSAMLRTAHSDALRSNVARMVTFDTASNLYWVEGVPRRFALPTGVSIAADIPTDSWVNRRQGWIRFLPDGSANGGRILLSAGGRMVAVQVDWLTGDTRTVWGR